MPKSPTSTPETIIPSNRFNPTLLAFKPRQVLLANSSMKQSKPNSSNGGMPTTILSPDQKGLLLQAVARFLETNGFSKTLKKFRSEAEIEKNGLKGSLLDLEEMYCEYSEMCKNGGTTVKSQADKEDSKEAEQLLEADKNCKEKKKKKPKTSDSLPRETEDDVPLKGKAVSNSETENESRDKKKKKNKSKSDSVSDTAEQHGLEAKQDANGIGGSIADDNLADDKSVKAKSKKKKKDGLVSESLGGEDIKVAGIVDTNGTTKKDVPKKSDMDVTEKENKGSKKRKRLISEGIDSQPAENTEAEESKRRKVEGLKASKGSEQPANSDATLGIAESVGKDSGQVGPGLLDGQMNGNLDKSAEKSSMKKSMKKQHNGSAEPKTAFQRVKPEEVEFIDERLKDNSYWAKDGAEIGYGAKAQEILGQVRGRDFRHEKTKKKRGTYRGGVIDQATHSVKFNYSDED